MILHRGKHWGQPLSSGYHCNTPILGHSVIITLKRKQMDRNTKEANEVEGISSQRSAGEIKKPGIFCFSPRAGSSVTCIPGSSDSANCSGAAYIQGSGDSTKCPSYLKARLCANATNPFCFGFRSSQWSPSSWFLCQKPFPLLPAMLKVFTSLNWSFCAVSWGFTPNRAHYSVINVWRILLNYLELELYAQPVKYLRKALSYLPL